METDDGNLQEISRQLLESLELEDFKTVAEACGFAVVPTKNEASHKEEPLFAVPLSEFMEGEKDIGWLVEGLIPEQSLVVLAAKPKVGKTIFSFNLAISLIKDKQFLGRETKKANVLIVQLEDPAPLMRRRFEKMGAEKATDGFFIRAQSSFSSEDFNELEAFILAQNIKLVVIDPLIFALRGSEQDASEIAEFLRCLREIIFKTGATILLVHHHRKSPGDFGDQIRGSSAILGAVDVALELYREDEDEKTVVLKITSRLNSVEDEVLLLDVDTLTWESQGKAKDHKKQKRREEILNLIEEEGEVDIDILEEFLGLTKKSFYKELKSLVEEGLIIEEERKRKGRPKNIYKFAENYSGLADKKNAHSDFCDFAGQKGHESPDQRKQVDEKDGKNTKPQVEISCGFSNLRFPKSHEILTSENTPQEASDQQSLKSRNSDLQKQKEEKEAFLLELAPKKPCSVCGGTNFWYSKGGLFVCEICHPCPDEKLKALTKTEICEQMFDEVMRKIPRTHTKEAIDYVKKNHHALYDEICETHKKIDELFGAGEEKIDLVEFAKTLEWFELLKEKEASIIRRMHKKEEPEEDVDRIVEDLIQEFDGKLVDEPLF